MKFKRFFLTLIIVLGSGRAYSSYCVQYLKPITKVSRNFGYSVSTNHSLVTDAAVIVRNNGGNKYDMMVAAMAASWVADPANSSPFGRSHWTIQGGDGNIWGINAATQIPINKNPKNPIPIPGNLASIHYLENEGYLSLPLKKIFQPAIELADKGVVLNYETARILSKVKSKLDTKGRKVFSNQNGIKKKGEVYFNPELAQFLKNLSQTGGLESVINGSFGQEMEKEVNNRGGAWSPHELSKYQLKIYDSLSSYEIRGIHGNLYEVFGSPSVETWSPYLKLGLKTFEKLSEDIDLKSSNPVAYEIFLLTTLLVLDKIPYEMGSLKPKVENVKAFSESEIDGFSKEIAQKVLELTELDSISLMSVLKKYGYENKDMDTDDKNTTHFTIADESGMISVTTSVGPWFGSGKFLYGAALAHSYALKSGYFYKGQTHDSTEQMPTIIYKQGHPWLGIGGAGSERIFGANLFTLFYSMFIDSTARISEISKSPRLFPKGGLVRIHKDMPIEIRDHLENRGFLLDLVPYNINKHLGILNGVEVIDLNKFESFADLSSGGHTR